MKLFNKYRSVREMLENESPEFLAQKFKHGKPLTRRDLIKAGAIQFAASFTLPSLLEQLLMPQTVLAQTCAQSPAFIGLKLNGGAAMMGNWIAKDESREFHTTYAQLGIGTRADAVANAVTAFGAADFYVGSQFMAGINQVTSPATRLNTTFVGIPVASTDDSANNPFDITYFVSQLNTVKGSILPNLGRRQTATGISQLPALQKAPPTPLSVTSVNSLIDALAVRGSLSALNNTQKAQVFSLIDKLSEEQSKKFLTDTGGRVLAALTKEATSTNLMLTTNTNLGIDPLQDNSVSNLFNTLWANNNNQNLQAQNANSQDRVFSAMVYNSLKGNAGTTNLELGGYDYHGNGRAAQDGMDLQAGIVMGKILESAAIMQRPVFLMVTSDGAVGAPAGSGPGAAFTSDRGNGGAIYMFAYHPTARPAATDKNGRVDHQIGQVRGEAAVDQNFLTGGSAELAGLAAFANYASFAGQLGRFQEVAGSLWNTEQIELVTRLRRVG